MFDLYVESLLFSYFSSMVCFGISKRAPEQPYTQSGSQHRQYDILHVLLVDFQNRAILQIL